MFISQWRNFSVNSIAACLLFAIQLLSVNTSHAQLVRWDPSSFAATFGPSPWAPATLATGLNCSGMLRGAGVATGSGAASGCWGGSGGWGTADNNTFTFTVSAPCHVLSLTSFSGYTRRSGSGPTGADVYYSINGGPEILVNHWNTTSTSGTTGTLNTSTLSTIPALQNMTPGTIVKIKIAPNGGTNNYYFTNTNNTLAGSMVSVSAPAITTSPSPVTIPAATGTTFSVSGVTGAASYQWQRNTSGISGGTWVNISSAGMDPSPGTYSGFTTTSTATSNTLTLTNVPAIWNGYGYRCVVTNCAGTATSTPALLTVSSGPCTGTPTAGTATPATATFCNSGSTTLSLSGTSTGTGLTYQWLSSSTPGGPYTIIGSATSPSYTTPTLTSTTYYRCIVTCGPTSLFDTSSQTTVTIDPLPTISATGGDVCAGGSGRVINATGASTYSWAPSTGLSAVTGATVTANPTVNIVYTVTGTSAAGCVNTTTVPVNYVITPSILTTAPTTVTACAGSTAQLLTATGGLVGPTTVSSGTVTIPASIAAFGTITTNVTVAGIPAGAVITGASVNLISFGSQYQDDYVVNIKAPNGNILNLINQRGTHTATVTTLFANTNLSSASATPITSGSGTYTGTWAADALIPVGGAPYTSNVSTWGSLFSTPNGVWTMSIYNNTGFTNTVVSSMQWSITLTYSYQSHITWSSLTDLYTDAAATTSYTGGATSSVYFKPTTAGTVAYVATASNSTCTRTATVNTTVNALPTITGADTVCIGETITLTGTPSGGTWTSSNANVSISSADITGATAGTSEITYTLPSGCYTTMVMTVHALPLPISGPTDVCEGSSILLSTAATGGTWSNNNTNTTVDAGGNVTGSTAGTSTISYTLTTGCSTTYNVTVNQLPALIAGPSDVCLGATITLTNSVTSGTWSSNNTDVTVDALGNVSGATVGTSVVSYILSTGCYTVKTITINALPPAITGPSFVCEGGSTIDLDNATTGGTWSRSNTNINIDAGSGLVTGVTAGTADVTYTATTGCYITKPLTINALPAVIAGTFNMCVGNTVTLSNATGTGFWGSANSEVSVSAATGSVTGMSAGTAMVSYTIPSGCHTFVVVTVDVTPSAITGLSAVCHNATIPLASMPTGGTWTTNNTNISVDATGNATGSTVGTSNVTYTVYTGCYATRIISVNALPVSITGPDETCVASSVTYTNTTSGGSWISTNSTVAGIDNASGLFNSATAGTTTVSYVLIGTGCATAKTVTVNALPDVPVGALTICNGATVAFTNTTPSGSWSSSNSTVASVDAAGNVHGNSFGTARISYTTIATGCSSYATVTVTATPSAILGGLQTCIGFSTALSNPMTGGTWSSGNTAVGTINTTTGVFTGIDPGTTTVTYSMLTGCSTTTTLTVNTLPPAITGTSTLCIGTSNLLMNTVIGGTWSSGNTSIVAVGSANGSITGVNAGSTLVSYTTGIGCTVVRLVTVNPLPPVITGPYVVCENGSINLANAIPGGTWTSGDAAIATIGSGTGIVSGITSGIAYITYRLPSTCASHAAITVNAAPAIITGSDNICFNSSSALSSATPGGTWSSSNTSVVTVSGLGMAFGSAIGTANISYTLSNGCYRTAVATVNSLPNLSTVTGGGSYCAGGPGVNIGLNTSQLGVNYTLYRGSTFTATIAGTGTSANFGLIAIPGAYTVQASFATTGCQRAMLGSAFVNAQPLVTPAVFISASVVTDTSCSGALVTFSPNPVNGGTAPAYTWRVNGVPAGTGATYAYTPANGDIVSVKMTSNIACPSVDSAVALNARVVEPSLAPAVAFSVFPGNTVCDLTPVTFTASPANAGTSPTYVWTRNGIVIATGSAFTYGPADNDVIKCIITSNYRCRTRDTSHSAPTEITVVHATLPLVDITATPGNTIAMGQTCTFTATPTNAGTTPGYQWTINGIDVPGANSQVFITSTLHNGDVVACTITSSGICSGITNFNSLVMTVLQPGSVEQLTASSIYLLPNPNNGTFAIAGLSGSWLSEDVTLIVTNTLGQKVHEQTQKVVGNRLDTQIGTTFPDGIYIATLKTATQRASVNFVLKH